jgi:NitT/TauT family transport system permease protein
METLVEPDKPTAEVAMRRRRKFHFQAPSVGNLLRKWWLPVASVVGGILGWQLVGQYLVNNSLFLATPSQAMSAIADMAQSGELWHHVSVSGEEFLLGYTLGACAGLTAGILIASFKTLDSIFSPWVSALYATPIVALAPLIILWFGLGIASKVAVVTPLVFFPVLISTASGIRATDLEFIEMAQAFGATRIDLFKKVSIPCALPFILAGFRLGIGPGLVGVVVGELFGSYAGLGFLIQTSASVFDMPSLFAGVIILALAGMTLTAGFRRLERHLIHWSGR